jgi:hypothetical protein
MDFSPSDSMPPDWDLALAAGGLLALGATAGVLVASVRHGRNRMIGISSIAALLGVLCWFVASTSPLPNSGLWLAGLVVAPFLFGLGVAWSLALRFWAEAHATRRGSPQAGWWLAAVVLGFSFFGVTQIDRNLANYSADFRAPDPEEQRWLSPRINQHIIDNFTLAAAGGNFTRQPVRFEPVGELALFIFTQLAGAALQPGVRIAGAMSAQFVPGPGALMVSHPMTEEEAESSFRTSGQLRVDISIVAESGETRRFKETLPVACTGRFSRRDRLISVDSIAPAPSS